MITKKDLANRLYDLNAQRGICNVRGGCGKKEWVRRILHGCGCVKPATKAELEQSIKWAEDDLQRQKRGAKK